MEVDIGLIFTILSIVFAFYYLQSRTKKIINEPQKKFNALKSSFNKNIKVDVEVQTNKLELIVFQSVLLGENNVLISLENKMPGSQYQLITNVPIYNRGYDEAKKEFLVFSRNIKQSGTTLDVNLDIWLTENNCIRYEFSDPHRE